MASSVTAPPIPHSGVAKGKSNQVINGVNVLRQAGQCYPVIGLALPTLFTPLTF